jgi:hypothetical protein
MRDCPGSKQTTSPLRLSSPHSSLCSHVLYLSPLLSLDSVTKLLCAMLGIVSLLKSHHTCFTTHMTPSLLLLSLPLPLPRLPQLPSPPLPCHLLSLSLTSSPHLSSLNKDSLPPPPFPLPLWQCQKLRPSELNGNGRVSKIM